MPPRMTRFRVAILSDYEDGRKTAVMCEMRPDQLEVTHDCPAFERFGRSDPFDWSVRKFEPGGSMRIGFRGYPLGGEMQLAPDELALELEAVMRKQLGP